MPSENYCLRTFDGVLMDTKCFVSLIKEPPSVNGSFYEAITQPSGFKQRQMDSLACRGGSGGNG